MIRLFVWTMPKFVVGEQDANKEGTSNFKLQPCLLMINCPGDNGNDDDTKESGVLNVLHALEF